MSESSFPTEWLEEFNTKIKSKKKATVEERFSVLLCNYSNEDQKEVLRKILFEDHQSIENWSKYVELTLKYNKSNQNKAVLSKMVKKGLECIEPVEKALIEKGDVRYTRLHLHYISLLSDNVAMLHISSQIAAKGVGKLHAVVYMKWVEIHSRLAEVNAKKITNEVKSIQAKIKGNEDAIKIVQKGILANAQPTDILIRKLATLQEEKASLTAQLAAVEDDVVILKKSSSDSIESDSDNEITKQIDVNRDEGKQPQSVVAAVVANSTVEAKSSVEIVTSISRSSRTASSSSASSSSASRASRSSGLLGSKPARRTTSTKNDSSSDDDNDETVKIEPSTSLSYINQLNSKPAARMPFCIGEVGTSSAAANATKVNTPAPKSSSSVRSSSASVTRSDSNELNDSVVEFKKNRKTTSSVGSSGISSKRSKVSSASTNLDDSVVSFNIKKSHTSSIVHDGGSDSDAVNDSTDSGNQATVRIPSPLETRASSARKSLSPILPRVAAADGQNDHSFGDTSLDMDVDTIAIDPAQVKSQSPEEGKQVIGKKVSTPAKRSARGKETSVPVVNTTVSPNAPSTVAAPASGGKRKRRVSFAGNDNEPPAAIPEVSGSKEPFVIYSDENRPPTAAAAPAATPARTSIATVKLSAKKTKTTSSSSSNTASTAAPADGQFKNNYDDPSNQIALNGHQYVQFGVIGKGGSGVVTRIVSKQTGMTYAYKRVNIQDTSHTDPDAIDRQFADHENEIKLLKQLQGSPLIIELVDFEINREALYVSMILEIGDIDLARVLSSFQKQSSPKSGPNHSSSLSDSQLMFMPRELDPRKIWKEMLECVQCIHDKNIIHGDLKPANFVFVRGYLKLIDFGIANSISGDTTNVHLESQKGTLNYMSPESLTAEDRPAKQSQQAQLQSNADEANQNERTRTMCLGRSSDVWSLGCILYQILYGRAPFADFPFIQKISVITNKDYKIPYPETNAAGVVIDPEAIRTIQSCLIHDRRQRAFIKDLLKMPFLSTKCACQCIQTCAPSTAPQNISVASSVTSTNHCSTNHSSLNSSDSGNSTATNHSQMMTVNMQPFKNVPLQEIPPHKGAKKSNLLLEQASRRDQTGDFSQATNGTTAGGASAGSKHTTALESTKKIKDMFAKRNVSILSTSPARTSTRSTASSSQIVNENAQPAGTVPLLSSNSVRSTRAPLMALPQNIQQQITAGDLKKSVLTAAASSDRAAKWQKTAVAPKNESMKSAIEVRMASMRQFLHKDEDNDTATVTIDNTFFNL